MKTRILSAALSVTMTMSVVAAVSMPVTPAAAITVFDPTNYAQNLLQAARALAQINNQIRSLQNEAAMLTNMAKNLSKIDFPELAKITTTLQKIDGLMGQAQAIDFRLAGLDVKFRTMFPAGIDMALKADRRLADAKARFDSVMEAFRHTMGVQAQVVENVHDDAQTLAELIARSQGAEGSLAASQATNQLLALTAKQQFQLQNLMAAQFRAQAVEQARRVQAKQDARAATTKFLGSGKAYTPIG